MRPLQSRAWTRRGEEEEDEDEDGVVDFPLCKLPPRAEIYRRRRRSRSRRIPSFFHLERFRIGASEHLERQTDRQTEFREERRERRGVCGVGHRSLFVV
jgi:hypothetical protein